MDRTVNCEYCGRDAELVDGVAIYGPSFAGGPRKYYRCVPCKAWVGCHPGTDQPLGSLANQQLRRARAAAHVAFDILWRGTNANMSRINAYRWLSDQLGVPPENCHIGMFNVEQCRRIVACVNALTQEHVVQQNAVETLGDEHD